MGQSVSRERLAVSNFPYTKFSLEYTLNSLERLGGGAMELYAAEPHFCVEDSSLAEARMLRRRLLAHRLHLVCFTPEQMKYPINIASCIPAGRGRSISMFEKSLLYAAELECPAVLIHAGYPLNDEPEAEAWKRSVESLSHLCIRAERLGVKIVMESVDVRWKTLLRNASKTVEMIRLVGSPALGAVIDTMTAAYGGEETGAMMDTLQGHVLHCHISDGHAGRQALEHLIPGEGELPLPQMLDAMVSRGYRGSFSVELLAGFEDRPEEAMKKSLSWLLTWSAHCAQRR